MQWPLDIFYIVLHLFIFYSLIAVLHKAGRHMEDTLIASYITLIIGYLILDDKVRKASTKSIS